MVISRQFRAYQEDYALIKKENQSFLINKEIQNGAVAKSYIRKPFLIYDFATAPF
jgi:hypothetical protein